MPAEDLASNLILGEKSSSPTYILAQLVMFLNKAGEEQTRNVRAKLPPEKRGSVNYATPIASQIAELEVKAALAGERLGMAEEMYQVLDDMVQDTNMFMNRELKQAKETRRAFYSFAKSLGYPVAIPFFERTSTYVGLGVLALGLGIYLNRRF